MASDYLLEIDGIKGESRDEKHKGTIEIESFSWGLTQSGSPERSGGAGKVVFQDIHFSTRLSSASPQLFLSCATGQHIKKATLFVRKSGGSQDNSYKVTLEDVLISSYQQSGNGESGDTVPTDSFSFNFAKIDLEYSVQKDDGSLDAPVKAGWDVKANKKI